MVCNVKLGRFDSPIPDYIHLSWNGRGQADNTLAIRVFSPRGGKGMGHTSTSSSLVDTSDVDRFLALRTANGGEAKLDDHEFTLELDGIGYIIGSLALA